MARFPAPKSNRFGAGHVGCFPSPPAGGARYSKTTPERNAVASRVGVPRRFTIRELADAYMATYRGRDRSRPDNLVQWCEVIGDRVAVESDADSVADLIERFLREPAKRYLGRDKKTNVARCSASRRR